MSKELKIIYVILAVALIGMISIAIYMLIDFRNDIKCSTTTDIKWFLKNNCQRYMEELWEK